MLGCLILYLKGMRRMMFQLSGFYCNLNNHRNPKMAEGRIHWLRGSGASEYRAFMVSIIRFGA